MGRVVNFPEKTIGFVIEDGECPLIDEELLISEISMITGISLGIVAKVMEAQAICFEKAGLTEGGS